MKPLLISSGEPAGIGPDLCLALAGHNTPLVILGDQSILEARAKELNCTVGFIPYIKGQSVIPKKNYLYILPLTCQNPVKTGQLNSKNASYVIELLVQSAVLCGQGEFSALVTAPVHKAIINEAGIPFSGHTEFFAQHYGKENIVMMLAGNKMKVALVTTHLPLREVSDAISENLIIKVISLLNKSLIHDFNIKNPQIKVAGLNPHAGENGYLGREENDIIIPALKTLQRQGIKVEGPFPADTLFIQNHSNECDAYVAMYHDQGLPVLKYADFYDSVNVTLGLPIVRTSVDHGTALELAGKGILNPSSMLAAVNMAKNMVLSRANQ